VVTKTGKLMEEQVKSRKSKQKPTKIGRLLRVAVRNKSRIFIRIN
jgi:hypothetical protein